MTEAPSIPTPWPREGSGSTTDDSAIIGLERAWTARYRIIGAACAGALLGFVLSFALPRYFTSSISFIPEEQPTASLPSGLSGLASQLGVLQGSPGRSPEFYARLLNGRRIREILSQSVFANGKSLTEYYRTGGRPDSVERTIRKLGADYSVSVDRATSIVRVDVELRDPQLAEDVAARFVAQIDSFNTQLRQSTAREKRIFVEGRLHEAQIALGDAEAALRDFLTQNRAGEAPALQFERGRLERHVAMAQELFLSLARGAQTARIDEVNNTPVISVVAPAFRPVYYSRPRRLLIAALAGVLGSLAAGALALGGKLGVRTV